MEPPERHRGRLRRGRLRRRQQLLRRAHRAGAAAERRADRAPLPLRHRRASAAATLDARRASSHAPRARSSTAIGRDAVRGWRELLFNASFQDRLPDIGVVARGDASGSAPSGPAARAAGRRARRPRDLDPRLAYDGFEPAVPDGRTATCRPGSSSARSSCGSRSRSSTSCSTGRSGPPPQRRAAARRAIGIGRVESPRGATLCVVERDGDRIERVRLRTGSYANWPSVAHAAADNLLPDFPLINKSFELCYACADR